MDHAAVRKVLETMRANIARYGFSPECYTGDEARTKGMCFWRAARDAWETIDLSHLDAAKDHLRRFVPPNEDLGGKLYFTTECLAHLNTDSALSIIDVALLALPSAEPVVAEPERIEA